MNNKLGAHVFALIQQQAFYIGEQEARLATFAGDQFVDCFRPVAKLLSQYTAKRYLDYIIEAKEMILQGKSEMETYEYFISKLQHLQEGE